MYSALLVDDESAVLDVLLKAISWPQFGVNKLYTASDGEQALAICQKNTIDLLITDIRMPGMDGLVLLEKVRNLYPHTHCILLTAYDEFQYAKTALLLGVENYILKPFQQDEMENTIEKALDNLYLNKGNDIQLFRNNILMRWANNSISENELSERALYLNINIYCQKYCVVCLRKMQKCSLEAYLSCLRKNIGNSWEFQHFWSDEGFHVIIIGGHNLTVDSVRQFFNRTTEELHYAGLFAAACGPIVDGCSNLTRSYQSACKVLMTFSDKMSETFIVYETVQDKLQISCSQDIDTLFRIEDSDERRKSYMNFADYLLKTADNDCSSAFSILFHSLCQLFEQVYPNKPEIRTQLSNQAHITSGVSSDNFSENVTQILEIEYLLFQYYYNQLSPIVQLAVRYIHTHYSESISLKEFCVKNKMNSAYLGYLFKKETGLFFNNYLTQYRIFCSFHLLDETDLQINMIAEKVGFSSPSYFISCFKKQTGLSPVRYRSQFTTRKDF